MSDAPKHPADPANEFASDNSAIDPRDFRNALGTFATGVTIVTAMAADGRPYGVTCNSFASVSLNPPLVLWSLGMFSQGLQTFQNASHFTVNVLGASQQALASQFAKSSDDKFAGVSWTPGLGNAPVLADSVASFQCRAANRYYGGDHIIFLGAVEAYAYNRQEPLRFAGGGLGRVVAAGGSRYSSASHFRHVFVRYENYSAAFETFDAPALIRGMTFSAMRIMDWRPSSRSCQSLPA